MPKVVDVDQERASILERSLELFARQGYGLVRMRDLAAEVGVSTGKLYHYFPDKRSIADALLAHVGLGDVRAAAVRLSEGKTRRERLRLLGRFVGERRERLGVTLLLALDHRRVEGGTTARDALRVYRAALTEQIGGDDEVLFTVVLGLLVRSILDPEALDLAAHLAWMEAQAEAGAER